VLLPGLSDCNPTVRQDALTKIKLLAPQPPAPECKDTKDQWQPRFEYAQSLSDWGSFASARLLLAGGLSSCAQEVRAEAKLQLDLLNNHPTPPDCVGLPAWEPVINAAQNLIDNKQMANARALLLPAIASCDLGVREKALAAYQLARDENPGPPPVDGKCKKQLPQPTPGLLYAIWQFVSPVISPVASTAKDTAIPISIVYIAIILFIIISIYCNRKELLIKPLNVVAGGPFDGKEFVVIATHISLQMDEINRLGAPELASGRASLATGDLAEATHQATGVAEAFGGDTASKLMDIAIGIIKQPRFIATGSINFGGRQVQVLIQLRKRTFVRRVPLVPFLTEDRVIQHWERTVNLKNLRSVLPQLAYEMLLAAADAINQRNP
jgi:hypothetical protein